MEVAGRLADEFPDGVWFFELAAVTDPAAVPDAVAAVLGITQQPGKTVTERVAAALEGRVRLLVIDNCEHVRRRAADLIRRYSRLGDCHESWPPAAKESESPTNNCGRCRRWTWAREPIPPPWPCLSNAPAASSRDFSVGEADEAAAVVEICRRLDGIPLAIELAASRMASMTVSEVRDRLDQRFRLLVGSRRGLERHQTLRHAVTWSYDHLDDTEKALLERCSVFAGGFDLESACAVMGSEDR